MNVSITEKTAETHTVPQIRRVGWEALLVVLLAGLGLWNLAGPGMWWDEGWTLSVARTWAERGFYGRLLDGQLAPPGLEAAITVTGPVALSFRLFGIGVWQGRLVGVAALAFVLGLMYILAHRLYNRRIAIGTVAVLFLTPMHPQLHPLLMARQVLAETPMFVYLLLGYLFLLFALERHRGWVVLSALCWGIGIATKVQALPFWAVSLLLPLGVALLQRQWRVVGVLAAGAVGAFGIAQLVALLKGLLLAGHTFAPAPLVGLYDVTAVVLTSFNRLVALRMILLLALPTVFALLYAVWRVWRARFTEYSADPAGAVLRLALLGLVGSWLLWYALLSVGVPRYLYPATFFGSIFVAAMLHDLTDGFQLGATLGRAGAVLRGRFSWRALGIWCMLLALPLMILITGFTLNRYYFNNTNTSAQQTVAWLETTALPNARIETYESELHFLLNHPYHYPPDQLHIDLSHRSLMHEQVTIDYDPLAADPDYLIVGQFARENQLYAPVIAAGAFRSVQQFGDYTIYARVR